MPTAMLLSRDERGRTSFQRFDSGLYHKEEAQGQTVLPHVFAANPPWTAEANILL